MMVYKLLRLWRWGWLPMCDFMSGTEQVWSSNSFLCTFRGCKSLDRKKRGRERERQKDSPQSLHGWQEKWKSHPLKLRTGWEPDQEGPLKTKALGFKPANPHNQKRPVNHTQSTIEMIDVCCCVAVIGKSRDGIGEGMVWNNGSSGWVTLK